MKLLRIIVGLIVLMMGIFYGVKTYASMKMQQFVEAKYNHEFEIDKKGYDFINGKFYTVLHPKEQPYLSFTVEDGYSNYKYVDYYAETVWVNQLEEDYQPLVEKHFPDFESFHGEPVYGTGLDLVRDGEITNYKVARAPLSFNIQFDKNFAPSEGFFQNVLQLVQKIQADKAQVDLSFSFLSEEEKDGQKPDLPFYYIPWDDVNQVKTIEDVKQYFQ